MQIRCNFPDISYFSETQKNNFQFFINDKSVVLLWRNATFAISVVPFSLTLANFEGKHTFASNVALTLDNTVKCVLDARMKTCSHRRHKYS